jgi:hypothetical protein
MRNLANAERESTSTKKSINSAIHKREPESPASDHFRAHPKMLHHFEQCGQLSRDKQPTPNLMKPKSQAILPTIETEEQGTRNRSPSSPKAAMNDNNVEEEEVKIKIDLNDPLFIFDMDAPSPTPAPPTRKVCVPKITPKAKVPQPSSYFNLLAANVSRVRSIKSARATPLKANMGKKRTSETKKKSRASSIASFVLDDNDDRISDFDAAYESSPEPDSTSGSDADMDEDIDMDFIGFEERELN